MRADQYQRLQDIEERLMDVFLTEADPTQWPGHGMALGAMDKGTRGDRYWSKRNAAATLSIIQRASGLVYAIQLQSSGKADGAAAVTKEQEEPAEDEIDAFEAEATKLLAKMAATSAKHALKKSGKP